MIFTTTFINTEIFQEPPFPDLDHKGILGSEYKTEAECLEQLQNSKKNMIGGSWGQNYS